jgi:hypothetical protein
MTTPSRQTIVAGGRQVVLSRAKPMLGIRGIATVTARPVAGFDEP